MRHCVLGCTSLAIFLAARAGAQTPSPSVGVGFGVDTAVADVRNVVSLVRAYLAQPDSSARSKGIWSTASEFDRRFGDLAASQANQGFPATVVGVISAGPGDSVYVVKILYAHADSGGQVSPLALERLYAARESGAPFGFRLSGALPRVTGQWERQSKGPLTFIYAPGQRPNPGKIDRAVRFVDSVAKLFRVPPPEHFDVVVGGSMDDVQRAIGLDFFPQASGPGQQSGGLSMGPILLVGNPQIGEEYFHEFVHSVLGSHLVSGNRLFGEGVATWLGGSRGRTPRELYTYLRQLQQADTSLRLSTLLRNRFDVGDAERGSNLLYATSALVTNAVYRKQGIAGVRRMLVSSGDPDALLGQLATELGVPKGDAAIDTWWRAEAMRMAPPVR